MITKNCLPEFFEAVRTGKKPFEVRLNDEPYVVGDTLLLKEYDRQTGQFSGRELRKTISYVLPIRFHKIGARNYRLRHEMSFTVEQLIFWTAAQIEQHGLVILGLTD